MLDKTGLIGKYDFTLEFTPDCMYCNCRLRRRGLRVREPEPTPLIEEQAILGRILRQLSRSSSV